MFSRSKGIIVVVAGGLLGFAATIVPSSAQAQPSTTGTTYMNQRVCATPALGYAACDAIRRVPMTASGHNPRPPAPPPVSYDASQIQDAYGLTSAASTKGTNAIVAVVDAYDDPNAYSDVSYYRSHEGLPAISSCTVSASYKLSGTSPCFAKVNQSGTQGAYPRPSVGWAEEISLDLDMVSAICPNCDIVLVEANSNYLDDLGSAVNTAAEFGPASIGNSYGSSEFSAEGDYASLYYDHPGIAITASTGDGGYGVEFPAAASSVIATGGTTLTQDSNVQRGWTETVWSGTGSGCSAYIGKPAWQSDPGCANRTVGDVAADANPNTGVNVYDTYQEPGWLVFGGTSVSAQIISGVYGLTGGVSDASGLYGDGAIAFGSANPNLYDVTTGSNGNCVKTRGRFANQTQYPYLCTGETGYDGPTGMGTPNGTTAF